MKTKAVSGGVGVSPTDVVHVAVDLDQFRLTRNRPISDKKVARLVKAIRKRNLLRDYPILVDRELNVIDGQHRLSAAKALGVPVYYRFAQESTTVADVALANQNTSTWSWSDYLAYFVSQNHVEYIKLAELVDLADGILTINHIAELAGGTRDRAISAEIFKSGDFVADRYEWAMTILIEMDRLVQVTRQARGRGFARAYASVRRLVPEFDEKRFLERLEKYPALLTNVDKTLPSLKNIEYIYNYHTRDENRIDLRRMMGGYLKNRGFDW